MSDRMYTDAIRQTLDDYCNDAAEQHRIVRNMIEDADPKDIKALLNIVLASENATQKVKKLYELSVIGGGHELAHSA